MKQHIYISKFPASPEATKRQQIHFEADADFAYSENYKFIKSSDDMTFQFMDKDNLVEVDVTEEQLVAAAENLQALKNGSTESFSKSKHTLTGDRKLDAPFFDDVASCFNAGTKVIEDAEGYKYTINSATSVTGIISDATEDDDDDYCIKCHNLLMIDQIINNTLLQTGKLTAESCDNMLKLAELKSILGGY